MDETVNQVLTPLQKTIDVAIDFLVNYSFQVVGAILILVIGAIAASWTSSVVLKVCERKKLDITLAKFFSNTVRIIFLMFAIVVALGKFGITIAPFIAAIGATAFGLTYAIQGPLSNYGAGLAIILGRPFIVGDTITVAGVTGQVHDIRLAYTLLIDEDGVKINIPSKHIVGEVLHNSGPYKIVEAVVGISYGDDPEKASEIILKALSRNPEVTKTPAAHVGIQQFGESSVNIGFRYWIPTMKYFETLYAVNLAVFRALNEGGITIPYPQREVRLLGETRK